MNKPTLWWRLIAVAVLAALLVLNHYAPLQAECRRLFPGALIVPAAEIDARLDAQLPALAR